MRITYNAPVVLTYTALSTTVMLLDTLVFGMANGLNTRFFTVFSTFSFLNPLDYLRLFSHAIGHASWQHLLGNFTFILLLGPLLEEKYGSKRLLYMIFTTAIITGLTNVILFSTGLRGASGVVFMMIILSSITNLEKGQLPLTFILVILLYLGREMVRLLEDNHIAEFAHIIGGICGAVFGMRQKAKKPELMA